MRGFLKPSLYWLLVFLPLAVWAEHAQPESHRLIFLSACLAIIPLAAVLGHATEHIAARAGEGLGIAMGSSVQIAIFVVPVLVLLSYVIAAQPMDLVFSRAEIVAVMFAAFIMNQIAAAGKSTWFAGVQLLAVYAIIAVSFCAIP